jgi:hypothetical protein
MHILSRNKISSIEREYNPCSLCIGLGPEIILPSDGEEAAFDLGDGSHRLWHVRGDILVNCDFQEVR